jgi:hypothetical protein
VPVWPAHSENPGHGVSCGLSLVDTFHAGCQYVLWEEVGVSCVATGLLKTCARLLLDFT